MRIAVVAPNLALRTGIRALVSVESSFFADMPAPEPESQFQVVFEGASVTEFFQASPLVDVLVLVAEAADLAEIQQELPDEEAHLAILLLSDDPQMAQALASLPLRSWGVLPVDSTAGELQAALSAVDQGLVVGTQQLFTLALPVSRLVERQEEDWLDEPLTERESQVLQLLAHGLANKQIALRLAISEHTVKFHISSIYNKLGVANRTEAVRRGVQRGLVIL
jgi:DNA-binding NarL/FixJ family response regulator